MSPLFDDMYNGIASDSSFDVCGRSYRYGYYLMNEIYQERACFVKSLSCPNDRKRLKFKRAQEKKMSKVMCTYIILHNLILEDECNAMCGYNKNEIVPSTQAFEVGSEEYLAKRAIIYDVETHHVLRRYLTEHIWIVDHIDLKALPFDDLGDQFSNE
ncbi:uncharacterized protein LOC111892098 [Lactuca sativa]|uniref:uncharacterized protein LOC111892098 n=1 Tax=Lactuca sativa TaxID=4236 RepID=UPI000CD9ED3A|nr:uncharacterized protein LOC111892098 [Lactuca sativa]